ncbi:unnamed protein product [Adineta steineri]|uniref:NADH dehydrogenase [ubiquinone] 1 alpha subcomplex subunit 13 n=1 Tax=Adineta steineri TaxID=433720 RepID=A0A815FDI5_9BILA|nr:unnamed protein product [Adineta steineri]
MEMDESRSCVEPLILAEQDRIVLRQYRANRDEETKLMKDVPDWEVGAAKILVRPKQTDIECNDPALMTKIRDALLMDNIGTL